MRDDEVERNKNKRESTEDLKDGFKKRLAALETVCIVGGGEPGKITKKKTPVTESKNRYRVPGSRHRGPRYRDRGPSTRED